jgi:hypothetical protein
VSLDNHHVRDSALRGSNNMYYQYDKSNNDVMEELLDKVSYDDDDDDADVSDVYDKNDGDFEDDGN